jgi:hypothetical protein
MAARSCEILFRGDIKPHRCLIRGCRGTAELRAKAWRAVGYRSKAAKRTPDDGAMSTSEWELWIGQNFGSYCAEHKCAVDGCNLGMKFDESGCLFNMCSYHCHKFATEAMAKEDDAKTGRPPGLSEAVRRLFSTNNPPKTGLRVHAQLPPVSEDGEMVRLHTECTVATCQRLQIVDSRGLDGACELCTEFPVLPEGVVRRPNGELPPLARIFKVDASGKRVELLNAAGGMALVGTGGLFLSSSILNLLTGFGG